MHPLLIIAAAAAAYWLGKEYIRRRQDGTLPWQQPLALPPVGTEVPTSPQGAANLDAWAQIDHAVDLFPSSAQRQWLPPPLADGMSIAPDCSAVAVGHGWWDRVAAIASAGYTSGLSTPAITTAVRLELLPPGFATCQTSAAGRALLEEIDRRVRQGRYVTLTFAPYRPQGPQGTPNPARRASLAQAIALRAIRRRRP